MSNSESRDSQIHAHPVIAQAVVPAVSIEITVHLWITWAELAIEHDREALVARRKMMSEHAAGDAYAATLGRETGEAILAICSASFAMDAIIGVWARLVMESEIVAKWESSGKNAPKLETRALEVFKRSLASYVVAKEFADKWGLVFKQRNDVVHYLEYPGSGFPHPSGIGNTAEVNAIYCQENATDAVDLLLATLAAITSANKAKLRDWIARFTEPIEQLRAKRG